MVNTPTDGGIVIFGPEVLVENNTIWVESHALLGGIVSLDFVPESLVFLLKEACAESRRCFSLEIQLYQRCRAEE